MSKSSYEEMTRQLNDAQMELKMRLEQVSRLRVDCAKLQLELLRLYRPQCLEILETLQDNSGSGNSVDLNNDAVGLLGNDQVYFIIIYIYIIM
ncbi:hypothetical protein PUN28_016560 [Cardiocondyla obscurior]|uniref:Uncharacterized protein n=1 Tax=Cardiocondyla obscurior TaxID=286306 RepID=A0AAW2EMQ7_9HYME